MLVESIVDRQRSAPGPQARGSAREWLVLLAQIVGGAFAIGFTLASALLVLVLLSGGAQAATAAPDPQALERLQSHRGSGLLLATPDGPVVAPLLSSAARLRVTGNTVRAQVTQRFANPYRPVTDGAEAAWLEGTYLFPLPDDAAVDHLRMRVGDRIVAGEIREKGDARRVYAQARAAGRSASMIEQQRPNAFRTQVANIAPGATIEIEIAYQQTLASKDAEWTLRLPTVVNPRYSSPGDAAVGAMHQPVIFAAEPTERPRIAITVDVDAGLAIGEPRSSTHRLQTVAPGAVPGTWHVQTSDDGVADRDFVLEWTASPAARAQASLRVERHDGALYGLLVVNPPIAPLAEQPRVARETTFVVDTSGSMSGASIEQARSALLFALERLVPGDRFNLIQFNSVHSSLFEAPRPVDAQTLRQARAWVRRLVATGGTEMRGALAQALAGVPDAGLIGQVVFITDGAVDYEDELVELVRAKVGERRLYTVGIGSAPNGYFMRKTAELGGGSFTLIGRSAEVERRMAALFDQLARPVATDLGFTLQGAQPLDLPRMPRDLMAGEPLVVALRLDALPTAAAVSGRHPPVAASGAAPASRPSAGGERWQVAVDVVEAPDSGLHVLWARTALEDLRDSLRQARGADAAVVVGLRREAVRIALAHHLVSDHTSLVAVDRQPGRPAGTPLEAADVPALAPAGWTLPQTATPAGLQLLAGIACLALGFLLLLHRRCSEWIAQSLRPASAR